MTHDINETIEWTKRTISQSSCYSKEWITNRDSIFMESTKQYHTLVIRFIRETYSIKEEMKKHIQKLVRISFDIDPLHNWICNWIRNLIRNSIRNSIRNWILSYFPSGYLEWKVLGRFSFQLLRNQKIRFKPTASSFMIC